MYVVKVSSGLGNQLFQYAFALYLQQQGDDQVYLDRSTYRFHTPEREFLLDLVSDLPVVDDSRIYYRYRSIFFHLSKFLFRWNPFVQIVTEKNLKLPVRKRRLVYFDGFWQTDRFIRKIESWERFFQPKEAIPESIRLLHETMGETHSISVHVRRGDYFSGLHPTYGICDAAWYEKAIDLLMEGLEDGRIYVFSDEPEWVREHLHLPAGSVIVENEAVHPFWYIWLMAQCRDHIVSNSSFSWWGAYMGIHPQKRVVAPKIWREGQEQNIAPDDWIRL